MAWAIFGIIYGPDGNGAGGVRMLFRAADRRARPTNTGVITAGDVLTTTTAPTGFFRVTLTPGKHHLWIGSSRRRSIVVPDAQGEYLLPDLLGVTSIPPEAGQNYRLSNGVRQLINATTGAWRSVSVDGPTQRFNFGPADVGSGSPNFRYRAGMLELADFVHGTWHAPYLQGGQIYLADDGATPVLTDRITTGIWQIRDVQSGKFRSWWISGATGSEILSFGPEVT